MYLLFYLDFSQAMATAEALAAETIMTSEGDTQTDPALMLESQPGEGRDHVQTQLYTKPGLIFFIQAV